MCGIWTWASKVDKTHCTFIHNNCVLDWISRFNCYVENSVSLFCYLFRIWLVSIPDIELWKMIIWCEGLLLIWLGHKDHECHEYHELSDFEFLFAHLCPHRFRGFCLSFFLWTLKILNENVINLTLLTNIHIAMIVIQFFLIWVYFVSWNKFSPQVSHLI